MTTEDYESWFQKVSGHAAPRWWQIELAADTIVRNRLIRIPTGMGKTLGVLLAWTYHRVHRNDNNWPTRLVWCLPMRTFVGRIADESLKAASNGRITC